MAFTNAGVIVARRLIAGTIDVPSPNTAGFHVDSSGNLGIGGTDATSGPFTVTSNGAVSTTGLANVGVITTTSLTFGTASSLTASDSIDLPVRPVSTQPANTQARQRGFAPNTSTLTPFAFSPVTVAGNLLIVEYSWNTLDGILTPPAGWTAFTGANPKTDASVLSMACYYKVATGGDAVPVLVISGSNGSGAQCILAEYSGILNAAPADVFATDSGNSATPATGTTAATAQAVELAVGFVVGYGAGAPGTDASGPTNGFVIRQQGNPGAGNDAQVMLDKTTTATGAQSSGFTWTVNGSVRYVGCIGTFKAAAVANPAAGHAQFAALAHGTQTSLGVLSPSGVTVDLMPAYGSLTGDVTIANTETVVISAIIPANFFLVGTTFAVLAFGAFTFAAGTSNWRIRVGPTTLTGNVVVNPSSVNSANSNVSCVGQVTCRSVGGAGTVTGNLIIHSRLGWAVNPIAGAGAVVALDTTVQNRIELTYISGAAGANIVWNTATWNLTEW